MAKRRSKAGASKRVLKCVPLASRARDGLTRAVELTGLTQVAVVSGLVHWLATQPDVLRACLLAGVTDEAGRDAATQVLERWVADKGLGAK
jgi:hypothetical protein